MILIQQDATDVQRAALLAARGREPSIHIDTKAVEDDLASIEEKLARPISKYDKKNLEAVKELLERFIGMLDSSNAGLSWELDGSVLRAKPIELLSLPEYSIEMTDYISSRNGKVVRIDYSKVLEVIAVELMYKDLGETTASMEEKLSGLGVAGVYPAYELLKHFDGDNLLHLSRVLKVGRSGYSTLNGRETYEYFGQRKFTGREYRNCTEYSYKHALTIIVQKIITDFISKNIDFKLAGLNESGIYFITEEKDNQKLIDILCESVGVKALGRRFEVKPKITIF